MEETKWNKPHAFKINRKIAYILIALGLSAGLYFAVLWAGNYVVIMPTSEFNQLFQ